MNFRERTHLTPSMGNLLKSAFRYFDFNGINSIKVKYSRHLTVTNSDVTTAKDVDERLNKTVYFSRIIIGCEADVMMIRREYKSVLNVNYYLRV